MMKLAEIAQTCGIWYAVLIVAVMIFIELLLIALFVYQYRRGGRRMFMYRLNTFINRQRACLRRFVMKHYTAPCFDEKLEQFDPSWMVSEEAWLESLE